MKASKTSKDINSHRCIRIKDKHGHFLGKIQNGAVYIYCKRCKEFYIAQNIQGSDDKNDIST